MIRVVRHPQVTTDSSSFLPQAHSSKAKIIALANVRNRRKILTYNLVKRRAAQVPDVVEC